ncbi:hypothetical protein B0H12DRAFT_1152587 [Mycena haematopus]|nr:hypothetical protein B0H12DRAFT_1152587 [Mycena haematopus]
MRYDSPNIESILQSVRENPFGFILNTIQATAITFCGLATNLSDPAKSSLHGCLNSGREV